MSLEHLEEIPLVAWIIAGVCVFCILLGFVLLFVKSKKEAKKKKKDPFVVDDGKVHKMHDLSFGFDTVHGREAEPEPEPEEEHLPVFNQVDYTLQATAVSPYTSWDYDRSTARDTAKRDAKRDTEEEKQEASFAGFVQQNHGEQQPVAEMKSAPVFMQQPAPKPAPVAPAPVAAPVPTLSTLVDIMPVNKPAAPKPAPKSEKTPDLKALSETQQLLLLKSHELLLTLTDGLKKVAAAKSEDSRKEKLDDLLAAVKILDAKSEWDEYKSCFEKLYPGFWNKLEKASNEAMTPYELRLCALLSLGMGSKEIAELTNRSIRTVETTVYKIRKKLNAESEEKTQDFLLRIKNA